MKCTTHSYPALYPQVPLAMIPPVAGCFCLLISTIFLCEFECNAAENVGLLAGRYSGTRRPDLYRTPQALQRVFGPIGPARHCGVCSAWQCRHLLPILLALVFVLADTGGKTDSWRLFLIFTCFHHCHCWLGKSPKPDLRFFLNLWLRGRTGKPLGAKKLMTALPLPLLLLLLLLLLFSSTDTGLWRFNPSKSGFSERRPKHVSTVGNASLFDNHSSSSSTNSWIKWNI